MYWNCTVVEDAATDVDVCCLCLAVYIKSLASIRTISRPECSIRVKHLFKLALIDRSIRVYQL